MKIDYIGYALAIISLIYAAYLQRKNTKIKEPVYSIRSNNLISDDTSDFPDLVVSYQGQQVRNFTFSAILFFNRGALTIDRTDIASLNPLRIVPRGCNILEAMVSIHNNPSNGITLTADETGDGFRLDFEYLDQDNGAILTVIHDGVSSENLDVVGDVKEVRSLRRVPPGRMIGAISPNPVFLVGVGLATLLAVIAGTISLFVLLSEARLGEAWLPAIFFGILAVANVIGLIIILISRSRSVVIPKGLEAFDE